MTSTDIVLLRRWKRLWPDHPRAQEAYDSLVRRYIGNGLPYHNLDHIRSCLELLDDFETVAVDRRAVELALWYHKIVRNPHRKDNEAASADFAAQELTKLGLTGYQCSHVMRLIIATKHDTVPTDPDAMLIVDIGLAILGASTDEYVRYSSGIRMEYSWVERSEFAEHRSAFLRGMLARPYIFNTPAFRNRYEAQARANLHTELAVLFAGT